MATLTLRPVIPAQPVQSPRSPVLDRWPIRRARLARHKAYESLQLARKAMKDRHILAARGYLDEAATWHAQAIELEARDRQGGAS